ncbi:MAG: protein O-GlcNAc transferase [Alphaproteobacteria bacterium]|jgi:predicted O-linked N-acetylglucosamine transferase (SPINDLY family)|nr:protein O-GlcNAc transferase [Alphaproteobacteria bacterium]
MTQSVAELLGRALNSHQQGRLPEAERFYTEVLKIEADHFDALHLLGVLKQQNGESAEALRLIAAALKTDATPDALTNYGNILCSLDRHQEGLAFYERALALKPDDILALANRGAALTALNRPEEALACYDRVLAMQPDYAAVHYNRGNALRGLKRPREALASYDRALALRPDETGALLNRANALAELGRHEEALTCYDRLLQLMAGNTDALNNRGTSLVALNRPEAALASYDNALALNPGHAGAHYNRGHALRQLKRYDDALSAYDAALAIKPNFADALYGRANALKEARRYEEAISACEKALTIAPDHPDAALGMFDAALAVCDWTRTRKMMGELKAQILQGKPYNPFTLLSCLDDAALHLRAAQNSIRHAIPAPPVPLWKGTIFRHDKIRLGYLSADFHPHPMASLLAELFERHDRARFEVTGISLDQAGDSEIRRRLVAGFDRFHDVRTKSDGHIASLLRDLEIDIAVDLNGHTLDGRPGVLALRPAPIQVNYLGYPSTIGADFIDYVIADRVVLPFDQQPFYSERIIQLPDCYQVNDSKRKISEQTPTRREAGLPDEGFVFCCFNNNYKITEAVFDIWMRLLKNIPGSVLWLLQDSVGAQDNLRKEAQARGVDPARLIFAGRLPLDQHLARHRLADLFLDTLPYNAHTTGSDALWAGLPVLTCQGNTFAARVAASLLLAVGLEELVTHNLEDYEAQALRLATEPSLLGDIRRKLEQNRQTHPLFDTGRFCRHIEAAYTGMWEIWQRGGTPQSFAVETIPSRSAA